MARSSLQIVVDQRTPITAADISPKTGRQLLRKVIRHLEGILGGSVSASHLLIQTDGGQPVAASQTFAFLNTVASSDTASINGAASTATQLRAAGTVTCASVTAGRTVTVGSIVFTAVNGGTPTSIQFDMSGTDTQTAASLVSAINAHATTSALVTAKNAAGVVTVAVLSEGASGNGTVAFTSSNNTELAVAGTSGGKLDNGADAANDQFDFKGSAIMTARSFCRSVNASTTALIQRHVEACNFAGSITLTSCTAGTGVRILGHEFIAVNGTKASAQSSYGDFDMSGIDSADATSLKNAINAHPVLCHQVVASSNSNVVTVRQRRGTAAAGIIEKCALAGVTPSGLAITTNIVEVSTALVSAVHEGHSGNAITSAESTSSARITVGAARLAGGTGSASGTTARVVIGGSTN